VGWYSATSIFDGVIDALDAELRNSDDSMQAEQITYAVAKALAKKLWDDDWDGEEDSDHFERFHDILCWTCRHGRFPEDCNIANPKPF